MAKIRDMHIVVMLHRDPRDQDLVDYTISKTWFTGKHTDKGGRQQHHAVLREGTFIYPQELNDVRLLLDRLAVRASGSEHGAVPRTPGRERSGFEHVPPQLEHPPQPPPEPTATTPEPPPGPDTAKGSQDPESAI